MAVKARLDSLPTEIKSRIAELCQRQDEIFQKAFQQLEEIAREPAVQELDLDEERIFDGMDYLDIETDDFKLGAFSDGRWADHRYPRSLSSLSSVSKEWREIAAQFLFRKVTARQCAKPIFPFAIAPRHGGLVQELDIASSSNFHSTMNIISSLAHLPRVRKISFPALTDVCDSLAKQARWSELPVEFASPEYVANALRRVARVAEVAIFQMGGFLEAPMFCSGSNLTTLELELSGDDLRMVHRLICGCNSLRILKIIVDDDVSNTFRNAGGLLPLGHPTLRQLEICDESGGEGLYEFVESLTTDLEELDISWGMSTPGRSTPSDPRRLGFRLPRLRKLEVSGKFDMSAPLVRHISPSNFPALRDCTWRIYQSDAVDWRTTFSAPVAATVSQMRRPESPHTGRAAQLYDLLRSTVLYRDSPPSARRGGYPTQHRATRRRWRRDRTRVTSSKAAEVAS